MSRAGNVTTVVTPVTLRSSPVTIPSRHHSSSSSLLEDDIGAGDYITLTSTNPALVFSSHQDRGDSRRHHTKTASLSSLLSLAEVPLDSITLDTDRGLVDGGTSDSVGGALESLNTANTRVILSSQPQARVSSQPQTLVTGMVQLSHFVLQFCRSAVLISAGHFFKQKLDIS